MTVGWYLDLEVSPPPSVGETIIASLNTLSSINIRLINITLVKIVGNAPVPARKEHGLH